MTYKSFENQEFMEFVESHQAGIGVILDWYLLFPKDAHGLAKFEFQETLDRGNT